MHSIYIIFFTSVLTAGLSAALTTYFNNEFYVRKKRIRDYKTERFMKLYYPIRKIIYKSMYPCDDYTGLEDDELVNILNTIADNMYLTDEELEKWYWKLSDEKFYQESDITRAKIRYDDDKKFADFIEKQYRKIKYEINII